MLHLALGTASSGPWRLERYGDSCLRQTGGSWRGIGNEAATPTSPPAVGQTTSSAAPDDFKISPRRPVHRVSSKRRF